MEIELKKLILHHIDVESNKVETINLDIEKQELVKYVTVLIKEILDNPNKRQFRFKAENTQVRSSILKLINDPDDIDDIILSNAKRLLEKEIRTEKSMKKLNIKVQRGSLIHIHFTQNDNNNILICKVEHDEIIDEKDFNLSRGLNTKKKVFKAFLNYLGNENRTEEIYLNDKNNSKYWWDDFLELEQVKTDDENTKTSVDKLISAITKTSKKEAFRLDNTILRNNVIGYFRNNSNFNFTDLYSSVFENYIPFTNNYPIDKIRNRINDLNTGDLFDTQFKISQSKIGKKRRNIIKMAPGLFLNIEDFVNNLDTILKPYSEAGINGMTILSDEAYNFVKNVERDN